uniref:SAM dependent carboxyl methyltransferase n=1 Tax=Candidatus Kentrum sp. SD TaxID=2126332 RepID=A0A451BRW2_9GAMM|nr:MAG: SAM dependent carboxyl methyltransferase [Candidatus Kentron sp. SD]
MSGNRIFMTSGYSEQTKGAETVINRSFDLLEKAIDEMKLEKVFRFCDYGTADGGTSAGMWNFVCSKVLEAGGDREIEVVLNDLPKTIGETLVKNGRSLSELYRNTIVLISPESFYNSVVARSSIDLGFSATAMHWLSKLPYHIKNHTHSNACPNGEDFDAFCRQSAVDWKLLLSRRKEELKPGGKMVFVNLSRNSEGMYLGHNKKDKNLHEVLHDIWRAFKEEGKISREEYESATFQNFYRSEEEYIKGVEEMGGLEVLHIRTELIKCPYRKKFDEDGDTEKFASGLTGTVRSWSEHVFFEAISSRKDARENKKEIIDAFYRQFEEEVANNSKNYSMDYIENYLLVSKAY